VNSHMGLEKNHRAKTRGLFLLGAEWNEIRDAYLGIGSYQPNENIKVGFYILGKKNGV